MLRGQSYTPLVTTDLTEIVVSRPGPFVGGTENARGDHDGTSDPTTLFTVTGDVLIKIYGVCTTNLAGATATIEVGVAGNTAEILAQSTATDVDAGDIWVDATVDDVKAAAFSDVNGPILIVNGADIIETIGTANISGGELYYVCLFRPLTPGSKVEAA